MNHERLPFYALIGGISIVLVGGALGFVTEACTKQQTVNAVNTGVQVAVDLCTEAPNLLPPGTPAGSIVALLCPLVTGGAPTVEVLIDQIVWNSMVKQYQASHPGFVVKRAP